MIRMIRWTIGPELRRTLAVQALVNHPLVGDIDIIEPLVDEMLAAHGLEFS
jgi:6-phospho-beta-glucosidase